MSKQGKGEPRFDLRLVTFNFRRRKEGKQWLLPSLEALNPPPATGAQSILDTPKISSDLGASVRTLQHFFVICQCFKKVLFNRVIGQYDLFLEI